MGASQSLPQPPATPRPARRPETPPPVYTSLDEKFDAIRISTYDKASSSSNNHVLDHNASVSAAATQTYIAELLRDRKNRLSLSAISANPMASVLEKPSTVLRDMQTFNLAIPHEGSPVTNQRSSGRCWIFAATNVFRIAIMQKYGIQDFELSQAYLFFWDKVEKANYFLESVLETAGEEVSERLVNQLMMSPVGDGGQWDMVVNLVEKYGIVPQTLYPDSFHAQNSSAMDALLTRKLREDALKLRSLTSSNASSTAISSTKESMMQDIIRILTLTLGPPPPASEKFVWDFFDKSHKLQSVSFTPLEFAASTHVKKFISLVNDPRNEYMRLLTVSNLGNVWGGRPITYVNVDAPTLKKACVAMLRKGLPIFFGSDVGKQLDAGKGIMDTDLIDYELGFNVSLNMDKAQRLMTGESQMTHAMVLTAVHLDKEGRAVRWRVENSWSESAGEKGYFVMSDEWMDEYCYQAVVDPSVVEREVREVLKQEPVVLPLWDPMGALA